MNIKLHIIFGLLNLSNVILTSNVFIKWLTNDSLSDSVSLSRVFPPKEKFRCEWWKLIENKKIVETGEDFIYGDTRKDCSLIIVKFDFKKDHLDIYKPMNIMSRNIAATTDEPIFVIAYLKSFVMLKSKKSGSIDEYTCRAKFLFPNTYDETLVEDIIKSLDETLIINGQEVIGSGRNSSQKESSVTSFFNNVKDLFKKKPKRDIGVNEITIDSDKVDVFVNGNNQNAFECSIQLIDKLNKKIVFKNSTRDFVLNHIENAPKLKTDKSFINNIKDLFRKNPKSGTRAI